jgi:hypothetical protein
MVTTEIEGEMDEEEMLPAAADAEVRGLSVRLRRSIDTGTSVGLAGALLAGLGAQQVSWRLRSSVTWYSITCVCGGGLLRAWAHTCAWYAGSVWAAAARLCASRAVYAGLAGCAAASSHGALAPPHACGLMRWQRADACMLQASARRARLHAAHSVHTLHVQRAAAPLV